MRRPERIDPGIVDENIHVAISKFKCPLRDVASAGCVAKIGRNKVCFASRGANFVRCLLPALRVSPPNHNMASELRQFLGCRETDSARSTRDKRCRIIVCHLESPTPLAAVCWMHTQIPKIEEIVGHEYVIEPIRSDLELQVSTGGAMNRIRRARASSRSESAASFPAMFTNYCCQPPPSAL